MKTKLLKQVRERFKVIHNQKPSGYVNPLSPTIALVYDKKGIKPEEMYYIDRISYDNGFVSISDTSLVERLVMEIKGLHFVYEHRNRKIKRKNLTFKRKYFN